MITRIEALRRRCLGFVQQNLNGFQVLVGPNAPGKTTFLDVISFLSTLVSDGPESAIGDRTANFRDLLWMQDGNGFELAIEARIPDELRPPDSGPEYDRGRNRADRSRFVTDHPPRESTSSEGFSLTSVSAARVLSCCSTCPRFRILTEGRQEHVPGHQQGSEWERQLQDRAMGNPK